MKYTKKFETIVQYTEYTGDTANFFKPNISLILENKSVRYHPKSGYQQNYLTFVAKEPTTYTLTIGSAVSTSRLSSVSYSLDNGRTWVSTSNQDDTAVTITTPSVSKDGKVLWKGNGIGVSTTTNNNDRQSTSSVFSSTGEFNAEGNVLSLVWGDDFVGKNYVTNNSTYNFALLFNNASKLVSAKNVVLPITSVNEFCYYSMFQGCTSLNEVPTLPGTTLTNSCYRYMFRGCTSLTTVPNNLLTVTTMARDSYNGMFYDCSSLTITPSLPASTLANGCYYEMFRGCTSLTTAPALTATTMVATCYYGMFNGCTNLTTAPALPALNLLNGCYQSMFRGCTSLVTAPRISATTVATESCREMFYGCTSLTNVQSSLQATTLSNRCYYEMFRGCSALTIAPNLPSESLAPSAYVRMFFGCTSLTTVPSVLPATTLYDSCYSSMFQGCSSLTIGPTLPATTLVTSCYNEMFKNCSNINVLTCLATDISASNCTNNWVNGVASSGTFYKNSSMNGWSTGTSGIPSNWVVENDTGGNVTGVSISPTAITIGQDNVETLTAYVQPLNAHNRSVTWSSSNSSIATVDSNGVVSGVAHGNATITVTTVDGGYTAQCSVLVSDSNYVELEYIESTSNGGQYIDLDIKLYETLNTWYDIAIKYNVSGVGKDNAQPTLFACQNQTNPWPGTFIRMNSTTATTTNGRYIGGNAKEYNLGSNGTVIELPAQTAPNKNVYSLNNGGSTHSFGTSLFCAFSNASGSPFRFIAAKLYYFKLFLKADSTSQGTLVRDMIPCKRISDNAIGLYDNVNDVFYTTPSGDAFVAGPEIGPL